MAAQDRYVDLRKIYLKASIDVVIIVGERRLGEQMAESLKRIIAPYLLRRTKAEVKADARARDNDGVPMKGPE